MAFSLTRPPSPSDTRTSPQNHDDDHLSSALHAALSSFVPGSHSDHPEMTKDKEKAGIDITVDSDCLLLRGTGVDVAPVLLKGHVCLHLTEATSIKEITLQFRGKARLPAPSGDALAASQWYNICNHEWSFLEGEKRHGHTLKAGFHQFPFQLRLGGSLPSSIMSGMNGGANVSYKLRALAVRPGLAHNMQAVLPISIIRSFAPASLEYQQSLEIENTWPEKLMYSIMIPHKAWAAGDTLTAIVKFAPISKGVRVQTITTTINETTKLQCRAGVQEQTRPVATTRHEIVDGFAIPTTERFAFRVPTIEVPQGQQHPSLTSGLSSEARSQSFGSLVAHASQDLMLRQVPSAASSSSSQDSHSYSVRHAAPLASHSASSVEQPVASTSTAAQPDREDDLRGHNDIVARLSITIPKMATPSHSLEPIIISHRIRWAILMTNLDGHTSELRCSLPLHILDVRLLDEARACSAATRRLLLDDLDTPADEEQDVELPSYSAHVRDRVANMFLPDAATTRVLNPWVHSNVSPTFMPENRSIPGVWSSSGAASPSIPHPISSHLPHVPQSGSSTPLDWVNSELLLSLSNNAPPRPRANASPHSHSPTDPASRPTSQPESRPMSRRGSRAPSPERHLTMSSMSSSMVTSSGYDTFVHEGHASWSLPVLLSNEMKPHVSHGWLPSRSNSHSNLASMADTHRPGHGHGQSLYSGHGHGPNLHPHGHSHHPTCTSTVPHTLPAATENVTESAMWHRAFTEVPDYDMASRGFIGGVAPLTSMRGLPSYEEAERTAGAGAGSARGEEESEGLTIGRRFRREHTAS